MRREQELTTTGAPGILAVLGRMGSSSQQEAVSKHLHGLGYSITAVTSLRSREFLESYRHHTMGAEMVKDSKILAQSKRIIGSISVRAAVTYSSHTS